MRVEQGCKGFSSQKRSIAGYDKRKLRALADGPLRDLHGVAGTALRLLQNGLRAKGGDDCADFAGLVSYDHEQLRWFERLASAHDVLDERAPSGAMQDFRKVRTHARPFASS
jgi:hypothetical protein